MRRYEVGARSTDTFGRVLVNSRDQHMVVDGPVQNGCPGEATTPAELFLEGVAACGVELIQVVARERGIKLGGLQVDVSGWMDPSHPVRSDVAVFGGVRLSFNLRGVSNDDASMLVETFKGR